MIEKHDTWEILDSTKIKSYLECPRQYFFEYILGWRPVEPNIHLEFGKAWHLAMEHLLTHGYEEESVIEAFTLFHNHYREHFGPSMDEVYAPKNPETAFRALAAYANRYAVEDKGEKVLYTEIAGTVPIRPDKEHFNVVHFRMDSIIQKEDGLYRSREHKTGSNMSRQWADQWALDIQTGIYNHVLYCLFPESDVWGVEINGSFFKKKECTFMRVPARRTKRMMSAWFQIVCDTAMRIEEDIERLELGEEDDVMVAFTPNPTNCTKYFGCRYHPYCIAWANPLQKVDYIPDDMCISFWDPRDEEMKAKHIMRLEG